MKICYRQAEAEFAELCQHAKDGTTPEGYPSLEEAIETIKPPGYYGTPNAYKKATSKCAKELNWGTKHFLWAMKELIDDMFKTKKPQRIALGTTPKNLINKMK